MCTIVSLDLMTALHRYFKPAGDVLPSPTGDLSASVSPATIKGRGPKLALALNAKIKTRKLKPRKFLLEGKREFRENLDPRKFPAIR